MKSKQEIEQLAESALNSLDDVQQVEANDFLYSKIVYRMHMREQQERIGFRRLMFCLSFVLILFIGVNAASFYMLQHQQNHPAKPVKSSEAAFAREYSLNGNSYNY